MPTELLTMRRIRQVLQLHFGAHASARVIARPEGRLVSFSRGAGPRATVLDGPECREPLRARGRVHMFAVATTTASFALRSNRTDNGALPSAQRVGCGGTRGTVMPRRSRERIHFRS